MDDETITECRHYASKSGIPVDELDDFTQDMAEYLLRQESIGKDYNFYFAFCRALDKRRKMTNYYINKRNQCIPYHLLRMSISIDIDSSIDSKPRYDKIVSSLSTISRMIFVEGYNKRDVVAMTGKSLASINEVINYDRERIRDVIK